MTPFELTLIGKIGGPLTKQISLDDSGKVNSDGSACVMTQGTASRMKLCGVGALAEHISRFEPRHALTLGRLRSDLPAEVEITTKAKLNGSTRPDLIARTAENFVYCARRPGLALLDFDRKGMPSEVADRMRRIGGFEAALLTVLPKLASVARLMRASTSAGLFRTDIGEQLPSSGGLHMYLVIRKGADVDRFLKALHARLWLAGFGWLMIGAGGQLLERSIIDRVVGSPERLVFEGPPILTPPLAQDAAAREPVVADGDALDTIAACPPLTLLEVSNCRAAIAKHKAMLAPEAEKARARFVVEQAERMTRRGIPAARATRIVERQCAGVLLPSFTPEFDDPDLAGTTVADILADPDKFVGETLADPLEGVSYGACKAKIMRRGDGSLWIHSFAHGRTVYDLKLDYEAAEKALTGAEADAVPDLYVELVIAADLTAAEVERLRDIAHRRSGIGKRVLEAMLKAARATAAEREKREKRDRKLAERIDPRPPVPAPSPDAEWHPVMQLLNEVHASSTAPEPPMRNRDDDLVWVKTGQLLSLHTLTRSETNGSPADTPLPPPPQMLIAKMSEVEAAEMIEHHVQFYCDTSKGYRPVHLAAQFVRHFMNRSDRALPAINGISSLPIVLENGEVLTGTGVDRKYGIVFRVSPELELPTPERCRALDVGKAMQFLCEKWLCDVATDYEGKAVIVACALTIIERLALPERPAFFVTAGQRGGGKTTTLHLISTAVVGTRAAAAAWSSNDEERRKSLFAYLGAGLALLVWDNIPLGASISCASIEKALTAETYTDRVLGESRYMEVPAYTIQAFTGNNITAHGDLASRALGARLTVDRPDPENRTFHHADAIGWTEQHRGEILTALYTILLGNPRFNTANPAAAETLFKTWWHLIGAPVEYAAEQHQKVHDDAIKYFAVQETPNPAKQICFREMFLDGEIDDEQSSNLATVLDVLRRRYRERNFQASEIASYAGEAETGAISFKAALELASGKSLPIISSPTISARLRAIKDRPTQVGETLLVLRYSSDHHGGTFKVSELKGDNG